MDSPTSNPPKSSRPSAKGEIVDILETISRASMKAINELKSALSGKSLQDAVRLLDLADSIRIVGPGDAFPVAVLLANGLSEQGRDCTVTGLFDNATENQTGPLKQDDLLVVIKSPGGEWPAHLVSKARSRQIPILAITESAVFPYTDYSDTRLIVPKTRVLGTHLLAGQMAVAQMLVIALEHFHTDKV